MIHYDTATETWTCDVCGWTFRARTPSIRAIAPRHGCPGPVDPAALTARLLAEIDAAIEAGEMAPWSYFPRDREAVDALLATHCQPCLDLSRAGCERVPWPCKRWTIWRQTVMIGWCKLWGEEGG